MRAPHLTLLYLAPVSYMYPSLEHKSVHSSYWQLLIAGPRFRGLGKVQFRPSVDGISRTFYAYYSAPIYGQALISDGASGSSDIDKT